MAQRVQVLLVCDLHGDDTPGTETITFSLDGSAYEIDACEQHARELRERFAPFVAVARRASGRSAGAAGRRGRKRTGSSDAAKIREWARGQGIQVPERGRIPADLAEKYAAAQR